MYRNTQKNIMLSEMKFKLQLQFKKGKKNFDNYEDKKTKKYACIIL